MNVKRALRFFAVMILTLALTQQACAESYEKTLEEQVSALEQLITGMPGSGSVRKRTAALEKLLYGSSLSGALSERLACHRDFIEKCSDEQPSLLFKCGLCEWLQKRPCGAGRALRDRVRIIELNLAKILGTSGDGVSGEATGPLSMRLDRALERMASDLGERCVSQAVPAESTVRLELMQTLKPSVIKKGDAVLFRVTRDLIIGENLLAVPWGAVAHGVVTKVRKPRMFGQPSEIRIKVTSLSGLGAESLPLTDGAAAQKASELEMSYVAAAGTSLVGVLAVGPVGLLGGLFIRGSAKDIPAGTVFFAQAEEGRTLPVWPVPQRFRALIRSEESATFRDLWDRSQPEMIQPEASHSELSNENDAAAEAETSVMTERDSL